LTGSCCSVNVIKEEIFPAAVECENWEESEKEQAIVRIVHAFYQKINEHRD
jgi:hypothetical protein